MEYESLDTFEIKERGTVFVVVNDKDRKFGCPDMIGKEVIIDGQTHTVKGIESFCIPIIAKGLKIGILV